MADEKVRGASGVEKEPVSRRSAIEKEAVSPPPDFEKEPISLEDGSAPPKQVLKHSHDADEAMKAFSEGEVEILDEETNRRLLRKIDLNIMPVSYIAPRLVERHANWLSIAHVCCIRTQLPRQYGTDTWKLHKIGT